MNVKPSSCGELLVAQVAFVVLSLLMRYQHLFVLELTITVETKYLVRLFLNHNSTLLLLSHDYSGDLESEL